MNEDKNIKKHLCTTFKTTFGLHRERFLRDFCPYCLRAEVYSAMAESLGLAWKDLNQLLEQRKIILDQNYLFQGHFQVQKKIIFPNLVFKQLRPSVEINFGVTAKVLAAMIVGSNPAKVCINHTHSSYYEEKITCNTIYLITNL
jgi:hypothetical protein